ncbi:hypothetical protein OAH22_01740 [bacterium]|jgi:hypothetical protein|nr:hypothetical protein [bacterium]
MLDRKRIVSANACEVVTSNSLHETVDQLTVGGRAVFLIACFQWWGNRADHMNWPLLLGNPTNSSILQGILVKAV